MFMVMNDLLSAPIISKNKLNFYFEQVGLSSDITVSKIVGEEGVNVRYSDLSDVKNYEACSELLNLLTL